MRSFLSICVIVVAIVSSQQLCEANDWHRKSRRHYSANCSKCHQAKVAKVQKQVVQKTTVVNNLLAPQVLMPMLLREPVKVAQPIKFEPASFRENFPQPVKAEPYKNPFVSQQIVNVGSGYFIQNSVEIQTTYLQDQAQAVKSTCNKCFQPSCIKGNCQQSVNHSENKTELGEATDYGYKEEVLNSIKNIKK
ncbi:hypothetical protein N9045_00630 [bacterium]|nr:hypothetical protein [bacterium]